MKLLTELPWWAGVTIMILIDIAAVSLLMAHEQRRNRAYLRAERHAMKLWAEIRSEQLAEERLTELRITEKLRNER